MARPAKSVAVKTGTITKDEEEKRKSAEKKLRGNTGELEPSPHLTRGQRKIFRYIVRLLKESEILGKLDVYILDQTAITVDRLQKIESMINENPLLLVDQKLMASKDKYTKDFFRCCNELCLSPQSRAKLAIQAAKEDAPKTIMDLMEDDGDE